MQWRILDDHVEINLSYITCAEYQLFIDEKRQAGENRQPDHWKYYRFPPGDAQKSITGVRASDAEEFCAWLTQLHSVLGFRYRLPTIAEAEENPATETQIGCWCKDKGEKVISGIEAAKWQDWRDNLAKVTILKDRLYSNLNRDFNCILYSNLNRDLNHISYSELNRDLDRNLNRDLNRISYSDLNRDLDRNLNRDLNRISYSDLNRDLCDLKAELKLYSDFYGDVKSILNFDLCDLNHVLKGNLKFDLNRILNSIIYRDLKINLNRDFNRFLNRFLCKRIKADEVNNCLILYFHLLFLIIIYQLLLLKYKVASRNREGLKQINLSHYESEAISRKYQKKIDEIYPLYVYLVLLDERQAGRIPAWEGIRLVRERIE